MSHFLHDVIQLSLFLGLARNKLHLRQAINLYRLFTIVFYGSKATFMAYLKNYIFIAESCCCI